MKKIPDGTLKMILATIGIALCVFQGGFLIALGVFLMIWSNNMFMVDNIKARLEKMKIQIISIIRADRRKY